MSTTAYRLQDRYLAPSGRVMLSGLQALARIPIEQLHADRRAGSNTAAFLSGYQGSPLGSFDSEIRRALALVPELPMVFQPALNEEYAATAVMGSQLAAGRPDARYDGVLGLWYGKGPGVDRAADALRHAAYAGTARSSGVVAVVGDDPAAKSSTIPSSSAGVLADLHLPLLYPADAAEALDLGRHAVALSRSTGLWAALKIVSDVADGTATVDLDPERVVPIMVGADRPLRVPLPAGRLLTPLTLEIERDIFEVRYAIATEYASANRLNAATVDPSDAWIGIVSSGITYRDVREALSQLGLRTDDDVAACGIRLFRMQMPIPFDAGSVRAFARGLDEVVVIEEKLPNLEILVKDALYGGPDRPRVLGKRDELDQPLVPGYGALDADLIVGALRRRLTARLGDRLAPAPAPRRELIPISVARTPFFCSGCPHNRSTVVPEGSVVGAGIGCHTMALFMEPERVGDIVSVTAMGNEGTQWIGMAPFVETPHLIQNLGDGTFFHSGQLAITAAVAAQVDITYKLLYNGAVAMTGGQHPEGQLGVADIAHNLVRQGVARVLITTDDPGDYHRASLPSGVEVWHRDRLVEAQELLAGVRGVTVLIHDQACAAESRRLRKRGALETPTRRVVIDHRICEGCGDCGRVSNCLSVQPFETEYGTKTRIDQTTCNLDYSCLEGDCPSFITIDTSKAPSRRRRRGRTPSVVSAERPVADPIPIIRADALNIRLTGIGGTGVVTVAQIIGTAAMLAGYEVRGLDQIGLSQKAGPVVSDLRLRRDDPAYTSRIGDGQADVLIALDQLVAASVKGLRVLGHDRTVIVGSTSSTPTGAMVAGRSLQMPEPAELAATIGGGSGEAPQFWTDAVAETTALFGDAQTANTFVVGVAVQVGALPLPPDHLEEAIRLNGVAVEDNLAAFRAGRERGLAGRRSSATATDDALLELPGDLAAAVAGFELPGDLDRLVRHRVADLIGYQDERLALGYLDEIGRVAAAERSAVGVEGELTRTVAEQLYRLLAYKDEYEVARLMRSGSGREAVQQVIADRGGRYTYRLHPPVLRSLGLRHKIGVPEWAMPAFGLLARGKRFRGTALDPFGHNELRRAEQSLPGEYLAALRPALAALHPENHDAVVRLALLPDLVRGYETLKLRRIAEFRTSLASAAAEAVQPGALALRGGLRGG